MKMLLLILTTLLISFISYTQVAPYPDMSYDDFLCADEIFKTQTICLNERIDEETFGTINQYSFNYCIYEETVLPAYNNFSYSVPANALCPGVCCGDGTYSLGQNGAYDHIINRAAYYTIDLHCSNNPNNITITKVNNNCWNVEYQALGNYNFNLDVTVRHGREIEGYYYCEDTNYFYNCGQDRTWKQFTVQVGGQYPCNEYEENNCNLIQNGGFEDMVNCPTVIPGYTEIALRDFNFGYLNFWNEITNFQEPYFYSACSDYFGDNVNQGNSQFTEFPPQPLPSGDNYIKFYTDLWSMGQELDLCPNQKYEFSFYGIKRRTINPNKYLTIGGLNTALFPTTSPITNLSTVYISDISLAWNQYSSIFTCPAAFNAISISGNQIMIDNLSLIPIDTLTYTFTQNAIDCDSGNLTLNIPGCYGPYDISMIVNGDSLNFNQVMDGHTIQIPLSSATNVVTVGSITNSTGCTTILNATNSVTIPNPGNAAFSSSDYCYGESNTINFLGDQGEFSLVNDTTGAFIHPTTGVLSNETPNVNYIIEHTVCLDHQFDTIMAISHDASFTSSDICEGGINSVVITGEQNGTFTLLPPSLGASINAANGILSGTTIGNLYEIQYIVGSQCADTSTVTILVNDLDDPTFTTSDFCFNETNSVTVTGSQGGQFTLLNSTDQTLIDPTNGELSNFGSGTTYTIQYLTNGACPDSMTQTVTVIDLPTVTLTGNGGDLCVNDSLPMFLSFTGSAPWSVTGSNSGNGFTVSGIINNATSYYVNEFGSYSILTVTDAFCTNVGDTIHTIDMTGDSIVLFSNLYEGCSPLEVTFWSNLTGASFDCLWNFGDGSTMVNCDTVSHIYSESGNYFVQLTVSSPQCSANAILQNSIEVFSDPIANYTIDPANPSIMHNTVQTTNQSVNDISSNWILNQSIVSQVDEPLITFPSVIQENDLCLVVESINHCFDTTCHTIFVQDASLIYLPNAFIPDNDGLNDVFKAEGSNLVYFELQVYNRWGEKIFESQDITNGWDGTYNGYKVEIGVYSYRLLYRFTGEQGNHLLNGHVTLIK